MIPEVIIAALIVAWVLGGRPDRLADAPIKHVWLVGVPVLMYAISWAACRWTVIGQGSWVFGALQLAGLASLIFLCAINRKIPGAILIGIGVALNAIAIASNGGFMPASKDAVAAALGQDYLHRALSEEHFRGSFMTADTRLWWLCDIIPKSIGPTIWRGVYSIGDMVMSLGVFIGIVGLSHVPKLTRQGARD